MDHFAQQHTVVTIDLAGHGQSGLGRESWTMEAFGEDVVFAPTADPILVERIAADMSEAPPEIGLSAVEEATRHTTGG